MSGDNLIVQLPLQRLDDNLFQGRTPARADGRLFGGAAVAQALLAAYATVETMLCHSLHAYFIHPGDGNAPVRFQVERLRDGGSFTTRVVTALQGERPILSLTASFKTPADGLEHQIAPPDFGPGPEALSDDDPRGASVGIQLRNERTPRPGLNPEIRPPYHRMWFRSARPLGDDIRHHHAALAYASDFPQLPTIAQPHPVTWRMPGFLCTSLDHALWFHRPFNFNNWHLCTLETPISSGECGLSRGSIFSQDGKLVASVSQEALLRLRP